ncbi:MAG: hypothetical protein KBA30_10515, partial [Clostridia bacterium]|nr:hypothetical protein [Clostridia bacterium]
IFPEEMALEPSFGPTVILQKKDTFVAACNGLTDRLGEAALRAGLAEPGVFSDLPHRLVRASLEAGSKDNLTLTVIRVMDTDTEMAKRAAGSLNDVTTQIPAGEIGRAAAALEPPDPLSTPIPAAASMTVRTEPGASPRPRSARVWRVLTPVLIFLCFVLVGIGAAKIAFSWDAITGRTGGTTTLPTTLPATEPTTASASAEPTAVPTEPTASPSESTPAETTAATTAATTGETTAATTAGTSAPTTATTTSASTTSESTTTASTTPATPTPTIGETTAEPTTAPTSAG